MTNTDTPPNILLFFTDQQRADTCGCYGQKLDVTPNLDAMAARGTRFARAMSMQPVCGPARSALMSGVYPTATGCFRNDIALPLDCSTVARSMKARGYETAYIGKWHLASSHESGDPGRPDLDLKRAPVPPERRGGFDDYWLASDVLEFTSTGYEGHMFDGKGNRRDFPEGRHRTEAQTDWVLEYLDQRSSDKPFFLISSYIEPHHQNSTDHHEAPTKYEGRFSDYEVPGDLAPFEGNWRKEFADYLGCCRALDDGLGRVLDKLKELGILDHTIVIFFADHGSHFKTRNREYKRSCHDASLHVPMVMAGPGIPEGKVIDPCVSLIDLPRTVLSLAGADPMPRMDGHDLQDLMQGTGDWPNEVFYQISENVVGRGLRSLKWKYAVTAPDKDPWHDPGSDTYQEAFLYDLENDPHELNNLVQNPDLADLRADLAECLKRRMAAVGEEIPEIYPASDAD